MHVLEQHGARAQRRCGRDRHFPTVARVGFAQEQPAPREWLARWPTAEQVDGAAPLRVIDVTHVGAHRLREAVALQRGYLARVALHQR